MELKLKDGKYAAAPGGGMRCVSGVEELAQRAAMKLTARRGRFWPCPEYGSELYRLVGGEKPADMESTVRQYAEQALADEPGLALEKIVMEPSGSDSLMLRLVFKYTGECFEVKLNMEDGYEKA